MSNRNKGFEVFVIIFVILTGAGFGGFTGLVYFESYWWVGMIVGAVSGYHLAQLYLKQMIGISAMEHNRKVVWLLSTLAAIICGIICTTLVHGVMLLLILCESDIPLMDRMDGLWPIVLMVGELVGACAGLIVGGICSWIYVFRITKESNETA
jgi:hypothetical protein